MPEVFVETIPFAVGALLGLVTLSDRGTRARLGWTAIGSLIAGGLCSASAGELGHDLLTAATAVLADAAAVAVGWLGTQVAMRHGWALMRRT